MPAISIPAFAETQQQLLLAEHQDEIASSPLASKSSGTIYTSPSTRRALQSAGHALTGIVLTNCRTGMGGREVGEFGIDNALGGSGGKNKSSKSAAAANNDTEKASLGAHGIRVGDIVRVEEIVSGSRSESAKTTKAGGKAGKDDEKKQRGLEGVVTRVGERAVWVAFGDRGKPGKQDDEGVDELWGRKLWL